MADIPDDMKWYFKVEWFGFLVKKNKADTTKWWSRSHVESDAEETKPTVRAPHRLAGRSKKIGGGNAVTGEALDLHPQGHPDRSTSLNNLGIHLSTRYNQWRTSTRPSSLFEKHSTCAHKGTQVGRGLRTTLQLVSSLGSSSSGEWRTSTGPLSSIEKHSTFAPGDTYLGHRLCTTLHVISPFGTTSSGEWRTSTMPLPSAEKHSAFAHKATLIDPTR
ncbi:hypothetical protein HD554DRAFT_2040454 [Boletus coccyginus]|nr:hypothetical protein HD554DRAFT_2040454 [Boletus coccyginus]